MGLLEGLRQMEKMPFREADDPPSEGAATPPSTSPAWRSGLPVLTGHAVTLRELRVSDAPSLLRLLNTEEVTQYIAPFPTTIDGWERFIAWTQRQRSEGTYFCFGVVSEGDEDAVGLFQVRQLEPGFGTADWDFALGFPYWGGGLFAEGADLVVEFLFSVVGARRLEGRCAATNHRGNAALRTIGSTQEGILRKSLFCRGLYLDQILWTIVDEDWRLARTGRISRVH